MKARFKKGLPILGVICGAGLVLAAVVLGAVDRRLVTVLLCSMLVYMVLFLGARFGLSRKL